MSELDKRVKAIRDSKYVGRNSCSVMNECYSDDELLKWLDYIGIESPKEALEFALEKEGLTIEDTLTKKKGYRVFVESEDGKGQITDEVVTFEEATSIANDWLGDTGYTWQGKTRAISMYGQVLTIEETV
jgi:hypothetical protein